MSLQKSFATARWIRSQSTFHRPPRIPWFVRREPQLQPPPQDTEPQLPPLPSDVPSHLHTLYAHFAALPHLERSSILVSRPPPPRPPPPIQFRQPQGRRRRGGQLYAGEGVGEPQSPWNWVIFAQVKEGTEGKGSIEVVMRSARQAVRAFSRVVTSALGITTKKSVGRATQDGWGFLDMGDTAIHVLSKDAREKWFSDNADYD
ncbi:uncharacterized protein EI90DRAFT_3051855 [Cantharellus anzutake]|uniref:uncharacterized protein n=1 Tax=Cantharellus anzutake TaxID=1750568 RepID=UPI001905ED96|nr:uncharacterized protein EI90DRAFT_3051855 [Cantharellus anzutake]KAF8334331.1 hypothetical protein EI90DRAFT_3051855 [Cantharellus anzutake]